MKRVWTKELMDDPGVDRAELDRSLAYIRAVNRRLGGIEALLCHLRSWSSAWPTDRPVTLLDVATGSADLPLAARRWAERAGFDLRVTGVDNHAGTLDAAREHIGGCGGIELIEADAGALVDLFGEARFDYVHAGLFLHHMPDDDAVVRVLTSMRRVASKGVIWNDLMRSRVGHAVITLLTVGQPEIIRHDARVSVRAGFTRREALALAGRAGWVKPSYDWSLFAHRFTVTEELGL
jgi:ubiquinone/menaquinone biosynthesis C-methylase UbiE